ncbi:MAG: branched-chain amino acid transport system II carrier protein [Waddliaceae bacterium]
MKRKLQSNTLSTGLAMFSMFFGAGNIVFPLAMGQYAQDQNFWAILGLLITAVGVPFLGLISMTLFDGNHQHFFERVGKIPGFLMILFIMGLIGPFGAMPRVIALSYSTASLFLPHISLPLFSLAACVLIYGLTYKRSRLLEILGYVLTPLLITSLLILIIKGLISSPAAVPAENSALSIFVQGLREGYNTMDLMGAFFFSSVVIMCLKKELHPEDRKDFRRLIAMTLKASCIGAGLLAFVYFGMSYIGAFHSEILSQTPQDEMIGAISLHILGSFGAAIAIAAVSLTCLTTAIALAAVFAEFLHEDIFLKKINYQVSLILTLVATFFMSTLNFSGIQRILAPILMICYPALITLALINLLHKLYGFKPVKIPVLAVFILSLVFYLV